MRAATHYETVIRDLDSGLDVRVAYFPMTEFLSGARWDDVHAVADVLNLGPLIPLESAEQLPSAIASAIGGQEDRRIADRDLEYILPFTDFILSVEAIPLHGSPLNLHSLAEIIGSGSPVAIGTIVGLIAAGPSPLVLITVPAGIILVGGATGLSRALEEGRDGIDRWRHGQR